MSKLHSTKGISYIIVLLFIIAIALVLAIVIPIIRENANEDLNAMDDRYVATAEKEAKVLFSQDGSGFSAVFDTETKKFYSEQEAGYKVKPYGTSKEHRGKYILVTVDGSGNITSEWIKP